MIDIEQSTILPHSYHCLGPVFQGRTCDTKETQCQTRLTLHTITWRHSWEVAARPGTGFQPPWFSHGNRTCSQPHHAHKAKFLRCKHVSCMLSPLPLPTRRLRVLESLRRTTSRNLESLHQCEIHYCS